MIQAYRSFYYKQYKKKTTRVLLPSGFINYRAAKLIVNLIPSIQTIAFLGFLIGPPVIGFVASLFDLRYSFLLFSIFGIVMVLVASRSNILKEE